MLEGIVATAKITKCEITPACGNLKFDGFDFSCDQYQSIAELVKTKAVVELTITPMAEPQATFSDEALAGEAEPDPQEQEVSEEA